MEAVIMLDLQRTECSLPQNGWTLQVSKIAPGLRGLLYSFRRENVV